MPTTNNTTSRSPPSPNLPPARRRVYTKHDLMTYELLDFPVWVFDIVNKAMWWANGPACYLWDAPDCESLVNRDFAEGMSNSTNQSMLAWLEAFKEGKTKQLTWTFHPNQGKYGPKTCELLTSGIYITNTGLEADSHLCMLVVIKQIIETAKNDKAEQTKMRRTEMLRHFPIVARQFNLEGKLMDQNPQAHITFGSPEDAEPSETILPKGFYLKRQKSQKLRSMSEVIKANAITKEILNARLSPVREAEDGTIAGKNSVAQNEQNYVENGTESMQTNTTSIEPTTSQTSNDAIIKKEVENLSSPESHSAGKNGIINSTQSTESGSTNSGRVTLETQAPTNNSSLFALANSMGITKNQIQLPVQEGQEKSAKATDTKKENESGSSNTNSGGGLFDPIQGSTATKPLASALPLKAEYPLSSSVSASTSNEDTDSNSGGLFGSIPNIHKPKTVQGKHETTSSESDTRPPIVGGGLFAALKGPKTLEPQIQQDSTKEATSSGDSTSLGTEKITVPVQGGLFALLQNSKNSTTPAINDTALREENSNTKEDDNKLEKESGTKITRRGLFDPIEKLNSDEKTTKDQKTTNSRPESTSNPSKSHDINGGLFAPIQDLAKSETTTTSLSSLDKEKLTKRIDTVLHSKASAGSTSGGLFGPIQNLAHGRTNPLPMNDEKKAAEKADTDPDYSTIKNRKNGGLFAPIQNTKTQTGEGNATTTKSDFKCKTMSDSIVSGGLFGRIQNLAQPSAIPVQKPTAILPIQSASAVEKNSKSFTGEGLFDLIQGSSKPTTPVTNVDKDAKTKLKPTKNTQPGSTNIGELFGPINDLKVTSSLSSTHDAKTAPSDLGSNKESSAGTSSGGLFAPLKASTETIETIPENVKRSPAGIELVSGKEVTSQSSSGGLFSPINDGTNPKTTPQGCSENSAAAGSGEGNANKPNSSKTELVDSIQGSSKNILPKNDTKTSPVKNACTEQSSLPCLSNEGVCDFLAQFVDKKAGELALREVSAGRDYSTEAQQITVEGPKWFTVNVRRIQDPVTSEPVIIYSGRDITQVMESAKLQADKQNMKRNEFFAVMAHEIRTPLHQVVGFIELLASSGLNAEQTESVDMLQSSAHALMAIINDLLDFTKLEAGKMKLEIIPFEVRGVLDGSVAAVQPQVHEKGLVVKCNVDPKIPIKLLGDPNRLRQIVLNMLSNAVKFTKKGEIIVESTRIQKEDTRMMVRFSVKDSGIGIPKDKCGRIFNPYQQADASVSRNYGGTGLGLAICKSLVENMGGTIGVDSELGKGATFWFEIPLGIFMKGQHQEAIDHDAHTTDEVTNLRILVAEDNKVNQKVVCKMLARLGHEAVVAENGQEAVDKIIENEDKDFDIVLMDWQMPVMDGIDATKEIRRKGFTMSTLPIVGLTASIQGLDWYAIGMNDCLKKPIRIADLKNALAKNVT